MIAASLVISFTGFSQTVTVSLDTVKTYRNDSVVMPVTVANFSNIGAITLYIQYDTTKLAWGRTLSWHAGLNGNIPLVHQHNGLIGISWIDVAGVTIPDGVLFEIKFSHKQGNSLLTVGSNSEFANPNGIVLPHLGSNGLIWEGLTLNPDEVNPQVCIGSSVQLNPMPSGGFGPLSYTWAAPSAGFTSISPTVTVSPTVTTVYYVTVTDGVDLVDTAFTVTTYPNISPAAPINMIPTDSTTDLYQPYTFSWSPSLHATHYDLYWWPSSGTVPAQPSKSGITQITYAHNGSLSPGTWYNWKVVARNACYATSSPVLTFRTRALPDLHVSSVTTSQPVSGQPLTVTWTVTNDGGGPTTVSNWADKMWLAPDFDVRVGEADDIMLAQFPNVSYLPANGSYVNTQTIMIPPNLMGPYFLFVMTDMVDAYFFNNPIPPIPYNPPPYLSASGQHGGGTENEINNNDNFFYVQLNFPVPPLADLYTNNIITPAAVFSGQQTSLSYTVINNGTNATPPNTSWWDNVWLSPDTVFSTSTAVKLAEVNHNIQLAPDSTYTDTVQVTIPSNIYGTYYFFIQNDVTNQLFENIGESNNHRLSEPINVIMAPPADLSVMFFIIPDTVSPRESVPVSWTVVNQGGAATPAAGHWDAIYISSYGTYTITNIQTAQKIGSKHHHGSLPIGGSYTETMNVSIPANIAGPLYLYVITDKDNTVFEHTQEANNLKRTDTTSIAVRPDLTVSQMVIPTADSSGVDVPVSWRINNLGPGKHVSGLGVMIKIYISGFPSWVEDSMTLVKSVTTPGSFALNPGAYETMTTTVTIPDGNPGPLYFFITVDENSQIPEENDYNNVNRSSGLMEIHRADLLVPSINIPSGLVTGDTAVIAYTITNNGTGHLVGESWKDRLVMSKYPVYNPDSTVFIGEVTRSGINLPAGNSFIHSSNFYIPHPYSGTWYLFVLSDVLNEVYEKQGELNNISAPSSPVTLTFGPWADLEVMSIQLQDTATQGDVVPLSFTIKNSGTKSTAGIGWKDRVYISSSPFWNSSIMNSINTQTFTLPLLPDSFYTAQVPVNISLSVAEGFYYLYVFTDYENKIYEHIDEGNNIKRSDPIYIKPYPPIDLATTLVTAPSTANSGNPVNVGWTVQNLGAGTTLASFWFDGVYLSQDPLFSPSTDVLLSEKKKTGALATAQSYSASTPVTIPNGLSGTWYILVVADRMDVHFDINRVNNAGQAQPIAITLTPSPDLIISDFTPPSSGIAGQPVSIIWKVSNVGAGTTLTGGWTDFFYLSTDYTVDIQDKILGSKARTGNLTVGQFYQDTITVFIPNVAAGNYILIIKTDNNNVEYEHNAENNNTVSSMLFVNEMPPADLVVNTLTHTDTAFSGDVIPISWSVRNEGNNAVSGYWRDNIHISSDTLFEITDPLLGYYNGNINNMLPLSQVSRTIDVTLPGLVPGDYYILVRTDVLNNINEDDENNNLTASTTPLFIDLPELQIGTLLEDTLVNFVEKHYRIPVPDTLEGESMVAYLEGDSAHGVNELYLTHNQISSRLHYDFSHAVPYQPDQEVMVPSLDSGSYYMLAYGMIHGVPQNTQPITLRAEILEFDVRYIIDNKGGNTGPVTIMLHGSKFEQGMTVYLDSNGVIIPTTQLSVIEIGKALASFNLTGAAIGKYDLVAVNSSNDTVRLPQAFSVIQGEAPMLGINVLSPANSRPGRISAFTIEFGNLGNVDLVSPVIKVESLAGAPIAFDPSGLASMNTVMVIPLSLPGEPPNILRPGMSGSIMVYTKSTAGLGFLITRQ